MVVYYESIKRELKIKPIYECRCDERLQTIKTDIYAPLSCGLILLAILVMPDAVSKDYIILHPSLDQEGQRTHSTPYDDI